MFLAVLDSVGVPIVGGVDALLVAISIATPEKAYLAAICAITGSLCGSWILFSVARKGGHVLLASHTEKGMGLRLRNWFERFGLLTVFIPAVSPIPMPLKIPVFCAGALEVRTRYFLAVVAMARVIRYFSLAYLGQRYGHDTVAFLKAHWLVGVFVVLGLCLVVLAMLQWMKAQAPPAEAQTEP